MFNNLFQCDSLVVVLLKYKIELGSSDSSVSTYEIYPKLFGKGEKPCVESYQFVLDRCVWRGVPNNDYGLKMMT